MKILIATDCYIYNMGGITASVLALSKGLRKQGHEVKILALSNRNKSYKDKDDYFIRSLPSLYYPGIRTSFAIKDSLLKELEEWNPDIIHLQTEGSAKRFANKILKHTDATMIMTCHTDYGHFIFGKKKNTKMIKNIMSFAGFILYRKAEKIVLPSKKATEFPFLQTMKSKMIVIPNGMEIEKYRKHMNEKEKNELRTSLGIDNNTKVLVTISRLSKEKNIREIISYFPNILKKINNVKILIVGDGPDKKYLNKMTNKLHLHNNIIFTGRIPSNEVWKYYDIANIFVSASTFEVHSMSYLEALANGLPMVCREDDALDGVVFHNKNGFIYRTKEEFVNDTIKLLTDDNLRKSMAKYSSQKAKSFSSDVFATSMIKLYNNMLYKKNRKEKKNENKSKCKRP